jgi:predicted deacylase
MNFRLVKNLKLDGFQIFSFGSGDVKAAITAGIHGDEQTAVYTAELVMEFLRRTKLLGTVLVIPLCNPTAFRSRTRESPVDNADLNRSFCKPESHGFSFRLADAIWETVKEAPFLLDLHCCGQFGSLYVMCMHQAENCAQKQRDLASALGIANVIHSSETPGQLFVHVNRQGRQAILVEMPGGQPKGIINTDTAGIVFNAAVRFLKYSGAVSCETGSPDNVLFHGKIKRVYAPHNGLFLPERKSGTHLLRGDIIGTFDQDTCEMTFDGTLLAVQPAGYIFDGEQLFTAAPDEAKRDGTSV